MSRMIGNRTALLKNIALKEKQSKIEPIEKEIEKIITKEPIIEPIIESKKNTKTNINKNDETNVVKNKEMTNEQRLKILNDIGETLKDFRPKPKKGGGIKKL